VSCRYNAYCHLPSYFISTLSTKKTRAGRTRRPKLHRQRTRRPAVKKHQTQAPPLADHSTAAVLVVHRPIDRIVVNVGDVLLHRLPNDTFIDHQVSLVFAIPGFRPFSPIPNPGIGGVPIPGFRDYKNLLKLYFLSFK